MVVHPGYCHCPLFLAIVESCPYPKLLTAYNMLHLLSDELCGVRRNVAAWCLRGRIRLNLTEGKCIKCRAAPILEGGRDQSLKNMDFMYRYQLPSSEAPATLQYTLLYSPSLVDSLTLYGIHLTLGYCFDSLHSTRDIFAHKIDNIRELGISLLPEHFHIH